MPSAIIGALPSIIGLVSGIGGSVAGGQQSAMQNQAVQNLLGIGNNAAQSQANWERFMQSMALNPSTFMQGVSQMSPTLNANLVNQANQAAASNAALQGTAGSPGQIEAATSQMLGPEINQNQLGAMSAYGNLLNVPGNLNSSLMNYASTAAGMLPPMPSGAGGFGMFANNIGGLQNLFGGGNQGPFPGFPGVPGGSVAAPGGPSLPTNTGLGAPGGTPPFLGLSPSGLTGPLAGMQLPTGGY